MKDVRLLLMSHRSHLPNGIFSMWRMTRPRLQYLSAALYSSIPSKTARTGTGMLEKKPLATDAAESNCSCGNAIVLRCFGSAAIVRIVASARCAAGLAVASVNIAVKLAALCSWSRACGTRASAVLKPGERLLSTSNSVRFRSSPAPLRAVVSSSRPGLNCTGRVELLKKAATSREAIKSLAAALTLGTDWKTEGQRTTSRTKVLNTRDSLVW